MYKAKNLLIRVFLACITIMISAYFFEPIGWKHFDTKRPLAEGIGKKEVLQYCTSCHSTTKIVAPSKSFQDWNKAILWMQKMQGMAPIEKKTQAKIVHYLEKNYPF